MSFQCVIGKRHATLKAISRIVLDKNMENLKNFHLSTILLCPIYKSFEQVLNEMK